MSDRPDLIQSELSGLAFDALQQCFRSDDIEAMMTMQSPPIMWKTQVYIIIDPAAGGPQSDFAILSMVREKGLITVSILFFLFILFFMIEDRFSLPFLPNPL